MTNEEALNISQNPDQTTDQTTDQNNVNVNQYSFFYQNTNNWDSEEVAQNTYFPEYDNNLS
jgi:hypothetical protein